MKLLRLIVSIVAAVALALPGTALGVDRSGGNPQWNAAGIIVKVKPGEQVSALSLQDSARQGARIGGSGLYRIAAGRDPFRTLATLRADPAVEWAEPDYLREPLADYTSWPNDPDFRDETVFSVNGASLEHARSWYLRGYGSISADTVWPYLAPAPVQPYGARAAASEFPVGVIDTGFYMDHPDKGSGITVGKDLLDTYTHATRRVTTDYDVTPLTPTDPDDTISGVSHGTCVAGEVAAGVDNGVGVVGAGYDTPVRIYKVQGVCLDGIPEYGIDPGEGIILDSAVVDAIYQATDDGCKVITMSLGGPDPSVALQSAVDYAHAHGVLVLAASGNASDEPVQYPAACQHVIGVGSYRIDGNSDPDPTLQRSSFTSYGLGLDLLAPGEGIWGLIKPDYDADGSLTIARPGYSPYWSGTSMATPLVAGGAAALWRLAPALSNDELAGILFRSARDMGPSGYDTGTGWGAFNMGAARAALVSEYPELQAPDLIESPAAIISTTTAAFSWEPVSGEDVTYRVALDGSEEDRTATSVSFTGLSEGSHTVTITAMSSLNWWDPVRSSVTVTFVVDTASAEPPEAPQLEDSYTATGDSVVIDWPDAARATSYRYVLDGAAPVTTVSSSVMLSGLGVGSHELRVCSVNVNGASEWVATTLIVERPPLTVAAVEGTAEIGTDRIGTAIAASRLAFPEGGSEYVVIATAFNWPDALGGSALAGALDAPILLTRPDVLPDAVAAEIARLGATRVIVLGGSGAVSAGVFGTLDGLPGVTAERIAGATRYETARQAAQRAIDELGAGWDGTALVATGDAFPDALGGSPLSAARGWPVYLVHPLASQQPSLVVALLADGVDSALVLGGTGAVPASVETLLRAALGNESVTRLGGDDRYGTAVAIASYGVDHAGLTWDGLAIATGEDFPDALAGGVLQGRSESVMLLTAAGSLPAASASALSTHADTINEVRFLGGTGAISSAVRENVTAILAR